MASRLTSIMSAHRASLFSATTTCIKPLPTIYYLPKRFIVYSNPNDVALNNLRDNPGAVSKV